MLPLACAAFVIWQSEGWLCSEVVQVASSDTNSSISTSITREFSGREIILSLFLITSICPVLWAPAWPPTFLFFVIHLRHLSPSPGQPVYFNPSTPWMSSFIHWLSLYSPHCVFFCWHNWSSALQEQVDGSVYYFEKKKSFLLSLLLHQSYSRSLVQQLVLCVKTNLFVYPSCRRWGSPCWVCCWLKMGKAHCVT